MNEVASSVLVPGSREEVSLAAVLKWIAVEDREKFTEDLTEVFHAKSEAHGLLAFWQLVVRWERFYPAVVQILERKLNTTPRFPLPRASL